MLAELAVPSLPLCCSSPPPGGGAVTCLVGAGREREASQARVVRAPGHTVDGVLVTAAQPALTRVGSAICR